MSGSLTGITDFSKSFDQYTWKTSHNAYENDIAKLLNDGARGLMLDVSIPEHPKDTGDEIYVCHTNEKHCDVTVPRKLLSTLMNEKIIPFVKQNPLEVVTIILENKIDNKLDALYLKGALKEMPEIENLIFDYSAYPNHTNWPTLQEIIDSGRRIIVITDRDAGQLDIRGNKNYVTLFSHRGTVTENEFDLGWNHLDHNWSCATRWKEGPTRQVCYPAQPAKPEVPAIPEVPCDKETGKIPPGCPIPEIPAIPAKEAKEEFCQPEKDYGVPLTPSEFGARKWKRLFIMNQFHAGMKSEADAGNIDNNLTYLERRVDDHCASVAGTRYIPNYIAIDYSRVGDVLPYAQALTQGGIYMYEHADANRDGDTTCVLPTGADYNLRLPSNGCENDEIRSMALSGVPAGTLITLFDDPDGNLQDDRTIIEVKRDIGLEERVVVGNLEDTNSNYLDYRIYHFNNNGLNGKISRIKIEQHPKDFNNSSVTLYEGYEGKENIVCGISLASAKSFNFRDGPDGKDCDNDEAKSLIINSAMAATFIRLYGDYGYSSCTQGCMTVEIKQQIKWPYTLGGFEDSYEDDFVKATRSGGSQQLAGKISSVKVGLIPDFVPPSKPGAAILTHTSSGNALVSWSQATDNVYVAGYEVSVNGGTPTTVTDTKYTVTNLIVGTQYSVQVRAVDRDGNTSEPETFTFTARDVEPPSQPTKITYVVRPGSATLSWPLSTDNVAVSKYIVTVNGAIRPPTTHGQIVINNLLSETDYLAEVRAEDTSGNISTPAVVTFRTSDGTKPTTPTNAEARDITMKSANLHWSASSDDNGVKGYSIEKDGKVVGTVNGLAYPLIFLDAGTEYQYSIIAYDEAVNRSEPALVTFRTVADTSPPSKPEELVAIKWTTKFISFHWKPATDNIGVVQYEVFKDGVLLPLIEGNNPAYAVGDLLPGVAYTFTVKSVDASGNRSAASDPLTVTTRALEPPQNVKVVSIVPGFLTVNWTAPVGATGYTAIRQSASGHFTVHGVVTTTTFPVLPGTYTITVIATGIGQNDSEPSEPLSVTIPFPSS